MGPGVQDDLIVLHDASEKRLTWQIVGLYLNYAR